MIKAVRDWAHPSHVFFVALLAAGIIWPQTLEQALDHTRDWFATHLGWLVLLASSFFVVFAGYLAFGKYGKLKLGGPDTQPQFSTPSWLAMLFAAGMGSGLIFYGAAEPLLHALNPPPSAEVLTTQAENARRAMAITFFHWGIHAWAIYAMAALCIAYYTFHGKAPMLPSAIITHYLPPRIAGPAAIAIDTMAILGVVFGLVASVSQALLQLSEGISRELLPGVDMLSLQLCVLVAMCICYTASASTGIGKGIKILSDINIGVALLVLVFILIAGPTLFIMDSFVTAIGDYFDQFAMLSFNMRPYSDDAGWTGDWSITYFLWWVSWGPFVGVFIARISRGRTIRQFLLGVICIPTLFSALWFTALGGSALHLELFGFSGFAGDASPPEIIFRMLDYFPLQSVIPIVIIVLLFIFLVTSADSGSYVLAMFTRGGELSPPVWERLFWGAVVGLVTAGAILTGRGTEFFRGLAVVGSIPYLAIMLWQCWALNKKLKEDARL